jgi:hypothetical protein
MPPAWAGAFPFLGVTVLMECTDRTVGQDLEAAFSVWRGLPAALAAEASVTLRVVVLDNDEGNVAVTRFAHQLTDPDRLFIQGPGCVACADSRRRDAVALVSRSAAREPAVLRAGLVEPLTLFLVSALDRQPFHCAGLVRDGRLVLLAGQPGVGKSTMACAGLLRGWGVMAEDLVWVQQQPRFRVWGFTDAIRLPPDAVRHFVQLADRQLRRDPVRLGAEPKVLVEIPLRARPFPPVADQGIVALLERGPAARLTSVDRGRLLEELRASLQPGFDRFPEAIGAVVEGMAREGGWRLAMGPDPLEAVACLEELIGTPEGTGSSA